MSSPVSGGFSNRCGVGSGKRLRSTGALATAALVGLGLGFSNAATAVESQGAQPQVRTQVQKQHSELDPNKAGNDQFIVKYKKNRKSSKDRAEALDSAEDATGTDATELRETSGGSFVVSTDEKLDKKESEEFIKALEDSDQVDYVEPDSWVTLAGRDLIGRARTGTGKTLAFALPIIMKLEPSRERARLPRAIVVAPTRELAKQVADEFSKSGVGLTTVTVYGGAAYGPQENALRRGVDVVVGTPGRLIDHLERGNLDLSAVQFAVLDEADEMLSVGFADAIETILQKTPEERQTMLFSATLNNDIKRLSRNYLKDPLVVDMVGEGKSQAAQTVEHLKVKVGRSRIRVLADLLTVYNPEKAIVFTRTKREADELANELIHRGLESEALHGDLAQTQRERALGAFRSGRVGVLVATDVAARGLDIPEVDLVVQYHLPQDPESYVHRSGRTGRAGRTGTAIIMYGDRENREVMGLERITGVRFKERPLPTPSEVAQASARASSEMVRRVDPEAAQGFQAEAEQLFSELGLEALARALAKISGVTEPAKAASLLSGEEGLTTLILHGERLSVPRTVALIARAVDVDTRRLGKVRQWRGGTVADVPSEFVEKLMAAAPLDGQVEVQVAQELPELFEQPTRERRDGGGYQGGRGYRDRDEGGRGGYGRGGNSGGGRGGYGNRGGNSGGRGESGGRWSRERDERGPRREDFADREFVPNR